MLGYLPWERPASWDDRPCVRDEREALTYAEFAERVEAAAEQFAEHGVGSGDVVAVMLPNRVELLVCLVAAWRLGATATPLNPVFTATEADYQIGDADAALVVNAGAGAPTGARPAIAVDDLRRTRHGKPLPDPATEPDDLALLIYTSGSTGRPKGVMLTHANLAAMAQMMGQALDVTGEDHCLLVLPLFHVNAICVSFLTPDLGRGAAVDAGALLPRHLPGRHPAAAAHLLLGGADDLRPPGRAARRRHRGHLIAAVGHLRGGAGITRAARRGRAAPRGAAAGGLRPHRRHLRLHRQPPGRTQTRHRRDPPARPARRGGRPRRQPAAHAASAARWSSTAPT